MLSQQFGAWVAAAITALSIQLQALSAPAINMVNFVSDPFNVVYTNSESGLESYLNQSTISITPNGTVIDGVTYDDVWLSHDAAEVFRTNAFDFKTAYSIASNTNGTFADGVGFQANMPMYSVNNIVRSQGILISSNGEYNLGSIGVIASTTGTGYLRVQFNTGSGWGTEQSVGYRIPWNHEVFLTYESDSYSTIHVSHNGADVLTNRVTNLPFSDTPFDFDYTSGTIPAVEDFDSEDGLLLHIPHHSGTSHLSEFIEENPEFVEPGGVEIDPSIDPDIHTKLGDLINIIAPLIPVINADFAPEPVAPVPVPDDTIADTMFSELRTILNNIIQTIASIPTAISALGDRILDDIELGPIRVFQKVLDLFRTIFAPVINLITAGIGIWSYVVSWLSAISLPFNFVLSVVPSGIMIPIYAGVAGWLVIAIFRRFGR